MIINFILNGKDESVNCRPDERLSTVLRENFHLLSVKNGCYNGQCGSCTLLLNNKIVTSCLIPTFSIKGAEIITEEGLAKLKEQKIIVEAFQKMDVELCDHCKAGRFLTIYSFLEENRHNKISEENEILKALSGNSCNCIDPYSLVEVVQECQKTRARNQHVFKR